MTHEYIKPLVVPCAHCGASNIFNQPYAYHAGFGNQGFLYSASGTCTLIWSSYDQGYVSLVGQHHPWALSREKQQILEDALKPAPDGGRFLFSNPARCQACGQPISGPITQTIYYLKYDSSIDVDHAGAGLKDAMKETAEPKSAVPKKP